MAKSSVELRCQALWYEAVHLQGPYCLSCGQPVAEAHHIALKSSGNWEIQFDTDFGITLCPEEHRGCENAPHVSPERFESLVLPRLLNTMKPARAAKIQAFLNQPEVLPRDKPDFKAIRRRLTALVRELQDDIVYEPDDLRSYYA